MNTFQSGPRLLSRALSSHDVNILVLSIALLIVFSQTIFGSVNQRLYWIYDDTENLTIANNLFHGRGLTIGFIDLEAAFLDTNIPSLSRHDEIAHPLQNKGPPYHLLLGAWLYATGATPIDWYFWGTILNIMIGTSFVIIFYIFVKRYFGREIAAYSTPVVALIPALISSSVRVNPDVLTYVFMLAGLYFVANRPIAANVAVAGLFAGLAHLTDGIGLTFGVASLVFLLYKKRFKAATILLVVWLVVLSPWMVRNYVVFGDISQGLYIPIPKSVLISLGLMSAGGTSSNLVADDFSFVEGVAPFDTFRGILSEFWQDYGMPFFMLFVAGSVAAFLSFGVIKQALASKKAIILLLSFLAVYAAGILIAAVYAKDAPIIQASILIAVPFAIFVYLRLFSKTGRAMTSSSNDVYILLGIFAIVSLISFLAYAQISGRVVPEIRIIAASLYMLVPLAIMGLKKMLGGITRRAAYNVLTISMISVLALFSISQTLIAIPLMQAAAQENAEPFEDLELHDWIRMNVPIDSKIASDVPHALTLRTGLESVHFYYGFKGDASYERWIIKKFDIDYVVFYRGYLPVSQVDLGDMQLELVYSINNNLVYKVETK